MYEDDSKGNGPPGDFSGELEEDLVGLGMEEVLATRGGHLLLASSLLAPSRPGCTGDRGTVAGVRVLDVVEEPDGLLHVMAWPVGARIGEWVPVWRDPGRRDRLERTCAATAGCLALLARERLSVVSTEIVAGMAWVEISAPSPALDLDGLARRAEPIEIVARCGTEMTIYLDGQAVKMVDAPIAATTEALIGVEVRVVAALDGGHEALKIPDSAGGRRD
jgi:hypothetical protein